MAVTATAAFGQIPNIGQAILTAAKSAPLSGSTNAVLLFTPGSNGSFVNGITALPRDTLSNTAHIAIYTSTDSGTTLNLVAIATLAAWTFAATSSPTPAIFSHPSGEAISRVNPLELPAGTKLYASSSQALTNGILVTAAGVDL